MTDLRDQAAAATARRAARPAGAPGRVLIIVGKPPDGRRDALIKQGYGGNDSGLANNTAQSETSIDSHPGAL